MKMALSLVAIAVALAAWPVFGRGVVTDRDIARSVAGVTIVSEVDSHVEAFDLGRVDEPLSWSVVGKRLGYEGVPAIEQDLSSFAAGYGRMTPDLVDLMGALEDVHVYVVESGAERDIYVVGVSDGYIVGAQFYVVET